MKPLSNPQVKATIIRLHKEFHSHNSIYRHLRAQGVRLRNDTIAKVLKQEKVPAHSRKELYENNERLRNAAAWKKSQRQ